MPARRKALAAVGRALGAPLGLRWFLGGGRGDEGAGSAMVRGGVTVAGG